VNDKALERAILLQDLVLLLASLGLAHVARGWLAAAVPGLKPAVPPGDYLHLLLVFVPSWAWGARRAGLYRVRTLVGPLMGLVKAVLWAQAWGAVALGVILTAAQVPLNRSLIALHLVLSTVLLVVTTVLQRGWVGRVRGELVALLLGGGPGGEEVAFETVRGRRIERLAALDVEALRQRLQQGAVDEVVLPRGMAPEQALPLLEACEDTGLPVFLPVSPPHLERARARVESLGTHLYFAYETHEPDRPGLLVKAIADRLLAAAFLILTLPLMLLVAAAIKVTSSGPVLFVQRRGGLNGRPFPMLKFRTMREGAERERDALLPTNEMDGPVFKMRNDPRITTVGRLLRRTSLDELPQLFNVLAGHMSLVGPRPLPLVETVRLTGPHRRRLAIRPGITGLWQVSGRNELGFEEWMNLDLEYADRWSLGLDIVIVLRTLPALITGRGAR
jgi:exopolysaccharide biosynthesis polyprenyl glycosylphosphotransferase